MGSIGTPQLETYNKDFISGHHNLPLLSRATLNLKDQDSLCTLFSQKCSTQHHFEECFQSLSSNILSNYSGLYDNTPDNAKSWQSDEQGESTTESLHNYSNPIDGSAVNVCDQESSLSEGGTSSNIFNSKLKLQIPALSPLDKMENLPNYDNYSDILKPSKAIYYDDIHKECDISLPETNKALSPYLYVFFHVRKIPQILSTYSIYEIC